MSQAEAWLLAIWAGGAVGSFVFWCRISREIPASERNDPFTVCVFWPLVVIFLAGLMLFVIATDDGRALRHKRKKHA